MVSTPWGDIPSFIFGGNTGIPSAKELEARRLAQIQRAARGQRPFPTTLGAGIASLGEAIGQNLQERRLRADEQAELDRGRGHLNDPRFLMPGTGPSASLDPRTAVTAAMAGPPPNPTLAAGDTTSPQELPQAAGGLPAEYAAAIAGIESAGARDPYQARGAVTPRGDRAYGRYQVMGANVPEWTQAALGQRLTPQQFLASKEAQDAVFQHRFGDYVNKYGPEGAARAWYAGEKGMRNLNATDQHGRLTVGGYGQNFMRRLQGTRTAAGPEGALPPDAGPAEGVGVDENPPTPTSIRPIMTAQVKPAAAAPVATDAPAEHVLKERPPRPVPPAPQMDPNLNPYEVRGHQLWALSRGNAEMQERAKTLIDYGAGVRKAAYDRQVKEYDAKIEAHKQLSIEDAKFNANLPELRQKYDEARVEGARKAREDKEKQAVTAAYGNLPDPVRKNLDESQVQAKAAAGSMEAIRDARTAKAAGAIFGIGADWELLPYRAAAKLGNKDAQRIVEASQTYKASLGPIMQATIKTYAGKDVSRQELEFVQKMAGSDATIDAAAAERILDIAERNAKENMRSHRDLTETLLKGQPETAHPALRSQYGVREPLAGVPMTSGTAPAASAAPIPDGATATGPENKKMIRRGGKWEPM